MDKLSLSSHLDTSTRPIVVQTEPSGWQRRGIFCALIMDTSIGRSKLRENTSRQSPVTNLEGFGFRLREREYSVRTIPDGQVSRVWLDPRAPPCPHLPMQPDVYGLDSRTT